MRLPPALLLLLLAGAPAAAQTPDDARTRPHPVPRLSGPVVLDGRPDEAAWQRVAPLAFTMHVPSFGVPPSEATQAWLAHDGTYLYLAGRLGDDPEGLRGLSLKRDAMQLDNDYFGLILDTFDDNETALTFWTTPAGIRLDFALFDDADGENPANVSWDTFWDVEVDHGQSGWTAEFRIPLSSLRFQEDGGEVVMGAIVSRYIARKSEWDTFPAISPEWGVWSPFKPSQAQTIMLEDVAAPRAPVYVTPYLLGGLGQQHRLDTPGTAYLRDDDPSYDAGLDLKYSLSSNLTLDLTINTDFAQVEADNQQINLTRFSLFFPEKRRFFQERSSLFDYSLGGPNRLFYSRRIGLYEGEVVRLLGGARLVGRVGAWDVGALDLQTARQGALPSENFGVVRLRRRMFNDVSYGGAMLTSRVGDDGTHNLAYGLDATIRVVGSDYLTLNWAHTFDSEIGRADRLWDPLRTRVSWARRSLVGPLYSVGFSRSGPLFRPGLGFEVREDYTRLGDHVGWGWLPGAGSPILRHQLYLNASTFLGNTSGEVESVAVGPAWEGVLRSGATFRVAVDWSREVLASPFSLAEGVVVPASDHRFAVASGHFGSRPRPFQLNISGEAGGFYDGQIVSAGLAPKWSLSRYVELSGFYELSRVHFDARRGLTAHVGRLRLLSTFSPALSAAAFVQYNSAIDAVITNVRFRFNPREGNDFYVVYNDNLNTDRRRLEPWLPFSSQRTILLKYTHTFAL